MKKANNYNAGYSTRFSGKNADSPRMLVHYVYRVPNFCYLHKIGIKQSDSDYESFIAKAIESIDAADNDTKYDA